MPDALGFTAIGSGSGFGSMSFGSKSPAGIGSTSELGYANSISEDRDGQRPVQYQGERAVDVVCEDV